MTDDPIPAQLDSLESDELEPEAIKAPDGRYRVRFHFDGTWAVLDPNDARYLAHQLTRAADAADAAEFIAGHVVP